MKKKFLSLATMLLLLLSMLPSAYAEEYCNMGSCTAGVGLNSFISSIAADASVTADTLPDGCSLYVEPSEAGNKLYLRGTPLTAGMMMFPLSVTGSTSYNILCSLDVYPAVPVLTRSADISCNVGEYALLSVGARVDDSGSLSYQWFYDNGQSIGEASGSAYTPDTSRVGVSKYYCQVTNTNNGRTTVVNTDTISVSVAERVVQGIFVETLPSKTSYAQGERLDTTGLSIRVMFTNGSSSVITEGFGVNPTALTAEGTQVIEISYQNQKCSFQVSVKNSSDVVEGIGVVTLPSKVKYKQGDALETAGLSIRVYTATGHFDVSTGLDCSPAFLDNAGSQTVTVSYGGKVCTFTVTVEADKETVKSISVAQKPALLEYTVGDRLDSTGLVINLTSDKGTEKLSTGFTCTPKVLTKSGQQEITVVYGLYTTTFTVTVKDKSSPSPSPSVSPSVSPSASPNPDSSASPSPTAPAKQDVNRTGGVNVMVKVIFIVAVLALGGLAAYVYFMRRKGQR